MIFFLQVLGTNISIHVGFLWSCHYYILLSSWCCMVNMPKISYCVTLPDYTIDLNSLIERYKKKWRLGLIIFRKYEKKKHQQKCFVDYRIMSLIYLYFKDKRIYKIYIIMIMKIVEIWMMNYGKLCWFKINGYVTFTGEYSPQGLVS